MNEAILELANTIGIAANQIVDHYIVWFIVSSTIWIILACVILIIVWHPRLKKFYGEMDLYEPTIWLFWTRAILTGIAIIMIGMNLPDIIASKAIAIHQLLKDISG